jgi:hypothetical protein
MISGFSEELAEKCHRCLMIFSAVLLCFAVSTGALLADDFSCGEWSNSSLQHQGAVSIVLDDDALVWSNETNSYHAKLIQSDTPQLAYSDTASIYMIYGAYSMNNKLYNSGYLRVRRVFFVEEVLKVSELVCE